MTVSKLLFKPFSWAKQRIRDWVLEFDIEVECFILADQLLTREERLEVQQNKARLVAMRSPQQIKRMEKRKGL